MQDPDSLPRPGGARPAAAPDALPAPPPAVGVIRDALPWAKPAGSTACWSGSGSTRS
jgi:hypothetical protein